MGKIFTLLLIVMVLTLPSLIISRQVSDAFAANNILAPNVALLWNFTTINGVWSAPTVDNGVLYVGCEDPFLIGNEVSYGGNLYALNATSGGILWNYAISDHDPRGSIITCCCKRCSLHRLGCPQHFCFRSSSQS